MFIVGTLGATIDADQGPFNKVMDNVFRDGTRQMKALGQSMTKALTLPLVGAGALAVKTAADYETLRTSMDILNGSVEEGGRNFERLKKFSAGTPFQLNDLASAQSMLQGFGLEADHAFNSLSMIGDISAATGSDINSIAKVFGKSAAAGRLMTEEILQLVDNGVPAFKLLADTMGVPQGEIRKLAETGKISFDILQQSFRNATKEGGIYADGAAKQAKTISGVFSTLKDNVNLALGEIGQSLADTINLQGLIGDLTGHIQEGIHWFNSLSDETRRMAFTISGLLGASGPVIFALGSLSMALGAITAPVLGAVAAVGGAAALIINNWGSVEEYFTSGGGAQMWQDLQGIISESVKLFTGLWKQFGDDIMFISEEAFGFVVDVVERSLGGINDMMKSFNGDFNTELNLWEDNVLTSVGKIDKILTGSIIHAFAKAVESTQSLLSLWVEIEGRKGKREWAMTDALGAFNSTIEDSLGLLNEWSMFDPIRNGSIKKLAKAQEFLGFINTDLSVLGGRAGSTAGNIDELANSLKSFQDVLNLGKTLESIFPTGSIGDLEAKIQNLQEKMKSAFRREDVKAYQAQIAALEAQLDSLLGVMRGGVKDPLQGVLNLGRALEGIFPAGSLGALQERLGMLRNQLMYATDPTQVRELRNAIADLELEIQGTTQTINFLSNISDTFTNSFGQGMANVFVQGENLRDTLENIRKLLMSSGLQKAISTFLTGGLGGGGFFGIEGGLFGKIFSGFRANGGDVMAGHSYVVGENGREIFSPSTNGSITPVRSGGSGTKKHYVNISGVLTGQGSELRAVINESHFIDLE